MIDEKILAEWKIRRIALHSRDNAEEVLRWALSSIGIDEELQDIYLFLRGREISTLNDIRERFNYSEDELIEKLDILYTNGLIEKIGRGYSVKEDLSQAIRDKFIPRIQSTLENVLNILSGTSREEKPISLHLLKISFREDLHKLIREFDRIKNRLDQFKIYLDGLKKKGYDRDILDDLSDRLDELYDELDELRDRADEIKDNIEDIRDNFFNLRNSFKEFTNNFKELIEEISRFK